jgi:hypothetical protein
VLITSFVGIGCHRNKVILEDFLTILALDSTQSSRVRRLFEKRTCYEFPHTLIEKRYVCFFTCIPLTFRAFVEVVLQSKCEAIATFRDKLINQLISVLIDVCSFLPMLISQAKEDDVDALPVFSVTKIAGVEPGEGVLILAYLLLTTRI